MKKTGIFYGTTTGNTAEVANDIAKCLAIKPTDVHNVDSTAPSAVGDYDVLIFGSSTWGSGEMQDDMANFIDGIEALDLRGKEIALFGCGDETMSDTFCNAVGELYMRLQKTGAKFIGSFNTTGYDFEETEADVNGAIVGLLIDNMNHSELTEKRVKEWCDELKKEL